MICKIKLINSKTSFKIIKTKIKDYINYKMKM